MLGNATFNTAQALGGGQCLVIPLSFSTDGSDDPTLDYDYDGTVSIARSTNDYVITLPGSFDHAVVVPSIGIAGTDFVDGFATDTTAGTVTVETNNGLTSTECQLVIFAYVNRGD